MKYRIFATLYEEATAGWVWLATPRVEPHRLVKLRNPSSHRTVYCEARSLDVNFVAFYNSKPHTRKIDSKEYSDVLIVGDWYREALGICKNTEAEIEVEQQKRPFWPALRASSQHPDPTVRLANRLGLLSAWLGLFGLIGIIDPLAKAFCQVQHGSYGFPVLLAFLALIGLGFIWGARGVRR